MLDKADLVLHEGTVTGWPQSDSVAVADGRIVAVGRYDELKGLVGPQTRLIRLAGRTVAPGFIDSHIHFMEGAAVAAGLSVVRCRTIADLLADLRVAAGRTPPGNWLRAFGCDEALMRERRGPTCVELDQAVPKNPLRLRHQTLHASWLNTRAIRQLGIDRSDFKPPNGAFIARDAAGAPSGLLVGMEQWISHKLPRVTHAELETRARNYSRELAASGITAITDATASNGADEVSALARLVGEGAVGQHVSMMLGPEAIGGLAAIREMATAGGIRIAGVKFMDFVRWDRPRLVRVIATTMEQGADAAFHVTEVEELEAAIDALEQACDRVTLKAQESVVARIEHGGLIPPEYPERIAALNAWVVTNPGFVYYRGAKYASDPGLIPYLYRARSLMAAGVNMAACTDAPVTPARPLVAIASAAARVSLEGHEIGREESIGLAEAFALFTTAGSRLARLGAGEIALGRLADLIVLPADPLTLQPAELLNLAVDLTIVGGRLIYERGRPIAQGTAANFPS